LIKETITSIQDKIGHQVQTRLFPCIQKAGLTELPSDILLVAYKKEEILEMYACHSDSYIFLKSYTFTATIGILGPKLKEGDKQIPEGIYFVEYLNPNSKYYLSLKINYPNDFDSQKATLDGRKDIGSDIFIHGGSKTQGCISIGDEAIEEVFYLVSRIQSSAIKVIISPLDFRKEKTYPALDSVEWSDELYEIISKELIHLNRTD
jgi:murein L,D-transpeptidase YafK